MTKSTTRKIAELEARLKAFEGINPDTARRAIAQAEAMADEELIAAGQAHKAIEANIDRVRADHSREIEAMSTALLDTETELAQTKISDQIKTTAINAGVLDTAVVDVLNRAQGVWRLDDDRNTVARDATGELMFSGGKPLTIPAWVEGMKADSGFLFRGHDQANDTGGRDAHGRRVIDTSQPNAIGRNLEAFAKGKAVPAGGEALANGQWPTSAA